MWQVSMLESAHLLQGREAMLLPQCRRKPFPQVVQAPAATEVRGCCDRTYSEPTERRWVMALPAGVTCLAFLPANALAGGVCKPYKHLVFLQPGPALVVLGFLKPCIRDTVSINQGGMAPGIQILA